MRDAQVVANAICNLAEAVSDVAQAIREATATQDPHHRVAEANREIAKAIKGLYFPQEKEGGGR